MIFHLVFDGVADGGIGVALDVVTTAARLVRAGLSAAPVVAGTLSQRVVSVDGQSVRTAAARTFIVDGPLQVESVGPGDVIVLAGLSAATPVEISSLLTRPDVQQGAVLLAQAAARGALVGASCSATFVLASSGVLDGCQATTTWWLARSFAERFPKVDLRVDRMVVEAQGAITAGSALAHTDLMLALISRTVSPSLAHLVASYLVLEQRESQARYMIQESLRTHDPAVQALERFVLANLDRQISTEEMACATAMSPRTLARRLAEVLETTPQRFVQRLRVRHAVYLLETTRVPIEEIAASVGYADAAAFRRTFQRETGESPRARRPRASRVADRNPG
ncbi:MAG TPA: helix-turn-helix domain-containing protein [Pseudomonadota bacterium]|nr:helix-turn-helix domain-containing protein [Pseudomonadota bacterium]